MKEIKIPVQTLLTFMVILIITALIIGWWLGHQGWQIAEVDVGGVKIAPPTSTSTPTLQSGQIPSSPTPTPVSTDLTEATSANFTPIPFTPTLPPPNPNNLIINGSFTDGFTGWERELYDEENSAKAKIVPFSAGEFGSAIYIENKGKGSIYFSQKVDLPTLDVDFSVTFKSTSETTWWGDTISSAGIIIAYLDKDDNVLGGTIITNLDLSNVFLADTSFVGALHTPQDTNTRHILFVNSGEMYRDYTINLKQELEENLLGIPENLVKKVEISIVATANGPGVTASLTATDFKLIPRP